MPRISRKTSKTNVYHIILRGIDKQNIFLEEKDYTKFLNLLKLTKNKYQYELYVYCLMSNHVHIVINDKENNLSTIIQSIGIRYSVYFNKKYNRIGHLFQNRFLSKNVETKDYLMRLCKYIHQNPVKAGISTVEKYKWSSYQEYTKENRIIDNKMIFSILGIHNKEMMQLFVNFHKNSYQSEDGTEYIEYEMQKRLTDSQLTECIQKLLKIQDVSVIKNWEIEKRNSTIHKLSIIKGTSKAQIARVIGMNNKIVERAMKKIK